MIEEFLTSLDVDPLTLTGQLVEELLESVVKISKDTPTVYHLKIMVRALKEMRYSFQLFEKYEDFPKVSVFGSARTPKTHLDYIAAEKFSSLMVERGWMCLTGGAEGIMRASQEGAGRSSSFGLVIRLPYEGGANSVIQGDEKHIVFRFFFTRKLLFLSQSDALAAFPGGFGTFDELFEVLTLMQTGKTSLIPIVLVEGEKDGDYWSSWIDFIKMHLLNKGFISASDLSLFYHAKDPKDATLHIEKFYRIYHSSRFVKEKLVFRLKKSLSDTFLERLRFSFSDLLQEGTFMQMSILEEEGQEHRELPRLVFTPIKGTWGRMRNLIDAINEAKGSELENP